MGGDEQLAAILEAIPASIAYLDRDQRFVMANAAFRERLGDIVGKTLNQVATPAMYEHLRSFVERALAGETVTFETRMPNLNGNRRYLQSMYIPDRDATGVVRGFTVRIIDISEQKRAQERLAMLAKASMLLASSVERDATAQAIASAAIFTLADWSAVYSDRFGAPTVEAVAHGAQLTNEEAWQLARGFTPQVTSQAAMQQGRHVVLPLVARGKRLAVLVIGALDDRSWTEEDLQLADELGRRASTSLDVARLFEQQGRANAQLLDADRRKDDLLAIVGHELRNPLAPIITALDVMEYRRLVGCERERAVIRRQAVHMSRLVDDLLDVSRIRRGKIAIHKKPSELHTIVTKAVELTSPLLEQREQQLTIDVSRELVIEADELRLTQVFANLLTNAAKYTQPRGHIAIHAARSGDSIAVTVSDDGPGIAAELLAEIFEPFVQGDPTLQRAEGGLGLGLSLVRSLTELHGGTATAASDGPGRGARFTVELPAYNVIAPALTGPTLIPGARLLLVDDNADAARVLAELLGEVGYDVAVAHDAPAALVLADEFHPEIALLDIGLPVMDGYELARHLRTRLPRPPRLVAVSGYGEHGDATRTREAGFDVHLGKPVDFEKLLSVLGSLSPS